MILQFVFQTGLITGLFLFFKLEHNTDGYGMQPNSGLFSCQTSETFYAGDNAPKCETMGCIK